MRSMKGLSLPPKQEELEEEKEFFQAIRWFRNQSKHFLNLDSMRKTGSVLVAESGGWAISLFVKNLPGNFPLVVWSAQGL